MSHYRYHLFFCCNVRSHATCCHAGGAAEAFTYAKARVRDMDLGGVGSIRVNMAGCLGRCDEGPVVVVYPDAIWYRYANLDDIEEILQVHCVLGHSVDRLKLCDGNETR